MAAGWCYRRLAPLTTTLTWRERLSLRKNRLAAVRRHAAVARRRDILAERPLSLPADLVRFALDSPLERDGFELVVPQHKSP